MISTASKPKTLRALGDQISKKAPATPYEVIEVFSKHDKAKLVNQFDRFKRNNGHFTVVLIGDAE